MLQCIAVCSIGELFGGVERHILGLLNGLQARGIATLLFLFHEGELATQAREQGFELVILPNINRSLLTTSQQMARILEQRQIQVVHVHGYKATVFSALARHWHPFTMVKTEHGLPELMSGRSMLLLREYFYRFLDSLAAHMASATICYVTKELMTHYRYAHLGLKTFIIANGIDSIDRCRLQYPPELPRDCFNLAIVGRLDTVKGHHLAIEAIAAKEMPPNLHLQIVGVGPCEQELRLLAEIRGIAHRVHFLGFRRNVYDYIANCHALLMPSLHEGLPYTLLEAMALGTPIIASHVGGLTEVLQDGVTGLLVAPRDIKALSQAIIQLYNQPRLLRQLGENAKRLQQSHYSLKKMAEQYIDVYQNLLPRND